MRISKKMSDSFALVEAPSIDPDSGDIVHEKWRDDSGTVIEKEYQENGTCLLRGYSPPGADIFDDWLSSLWKPTNTGEFIDWHLMEPEPTDWVVDGLIAREACTLLGANMKAGKSWLTMDLAVCLAAGLPFLDFEISKAGITLLYSPEGTKKGLVRRLHGVCAGHNIDPRAIGDSIRAWTGRLQLLEKSTVEQLKIVIDSVEPDLLVIDPLITAMAGIDENNAGSTQTGLNVIRHLSEHRPEMGIIVAHHYGKTDKGEARSTPWHKLRGSSGLGAWGDCLITLEAVESPDSPDPTTAIEVRHRDDVDPEPIAFTRKITEIAPGKLVVKLQPCVLSTSEKTRRQEQILSLVRARPAEFSAKMLAVLLMPTEEREDLKAKDAWYRKVKRDVAELLAKQVLERIEGKLQIQPDKIIPMPTSGERG